MSKCYKSEFLSIFKTIAVHENRYKVFRDFILMAGISIQNSILKSDELEKEYLEIVGTYTQDDVMKFPQLLSCVVMGLESKFSDFLGAVFMELDFGSAHSGQFFTPYEVSKMMAEVNFGSASELLDRQPFITLSEPACGAGGMVIAFAETMLDQGGNPQEQLWVNCIDVDIVAGMMCYVQLSLLGIPGEVVIGNTLSMKFTRVFRTPMHFLGFWDGKLRRKFAESESKLLVSEEVVEDEPTIDEGQALQPIATVFTDQMSLFDVVA